MIAKHFVTELTSRIHLKTKYFIFLGNHFVYWFLRKSGHLLKLLKFNAHGFTDCSTASIC